MRVICIGDSITYGQNVRACEAWPAVLECLTGHDVRNAGVCGDTTRLGLERFPKDVQLHDPDVVVIQFGHNDANCWESDSGVPRVSCAAYCANLAEMAERARAIGAEPIVIAPHYAPLRDAEYNARLRAYWLLVDADAIEVHAPCPGSFLDDGYGLHPDASMHAAYARAVAAAL